ncbi:hypothetical protein [Luteolibacter soli]|uniref:Uncharacterized protein n=1 Tax=Luteolibacter soli TaxID=3135280 RepID=A0ABU9AV71_9BACT
MTADPAKPDPLELLESIAGPLPADVLAATPPEVRQRLATLGHAAAGLLRASGSTESHENLASEIDTWADKHLSE